MKTRILVGVASVLLLATVAKAHTHLSSSEPADGSVVVASPTNFVAHFSEPTRVTALTIARDGGNEEKVTPPGNATQHVSAALPRLEPGKYVLTWRAVGADSHVMSGKVAFTFDPKGKPTTGKAEAHKHSH